jgi:hypothetical protein
MNIHDIRRSGRYSNRIPLESKSNGYRVSHLAQPLGRESNLGFRAQSMSALLVKNPTAELNTSSLYKV